MSDAHPAGQRLTGLSPKAYQHPADRAATAALAAIPMPGAVESLNAGVAAGIALYEISRRR